MSSEQRTYSGLRFWILFLAGLALLALVLTLFIVVIHAADPALIDPTSLAPLVYMMSGMAGASTVLAILYFFLRYPQSQRVILLLLLIAGGIALAHFYTVDTPSTDHCMDTSKGVQGCVMDEVYYVPAAQSLLSGEKCGPYLDNCNMEHPFLSKAFIAAGIAIFGNGVFGWRFFEILLGTASIPVMFAIVWTVSKDSTFAIFAAFLLGFETLFFVHSSIAVIDVQSIFFALLGFLFYFSDFRFWVLNRYSLAGISLGIAALCKETAVFLVAFLVLYHLLFGIGTKKSRVLSSIQMFVIIGLVFAAGLQIYVSLFGNNSVHTFIDDIRFILQYGSSLKMTPTSPGWIDSVLGTPITPWNWITYYSPIGYLITRVTVTTPTSVFSYVSVGYYGVSSDLEVWFTYIWIGFVIYTGVRLWRTHNPDLGLSLGPGWRLAKFATLWFFVTYVPYIALFYYGRITYPYYFVQTMPGLSMGCAYLLSRRSFPREVAYVFLAGVFMWFFLFYPDKSFLPTQWRVALGH